MGQATKKKKKIFDGRYEIISIVGRGTCSVVYRARHVMSPSSEVALKVLLDRKGPGSNSDRLRKEALAMVSSRHKYVIRLDDFHSVDSLCYLAMEYAPESDLRAYAKNKGGKLSVDQIQKFFFQIAEALAFIHQGGITHRDIKPDNILVVNDDEVRLADFGVAILPGEESSIEELRSGVGTMDYMAPEVFQGTGCDKRSDVYLLGVTFYELLASVHPFADIPIASVLDARKDDQIPPLSARNAEVSPELAEIVMRAIKYNPEDRFESAKQLYDTLKATCGEISNVVPIDKPATDAPKNPFEQRLEDSSKKKAEDMYKTYDPLFADVRNPDAPASPFGQPIESASGEAKKFGFDQPAEEQPFQQPVSFEPEPKAAAEPEESTPANDPEPTFEPIVDKKPEEPKPAFEPIVDQKPEEPAFEPIVDQKPEEPAFEPIVDQKADEPEPFSPPEPTVEPEPAPEPQAFAEPEAPTEPEPAVDSSFAPVADAVEQFSPFQSVQDLKPEAAAEEEVEKVAEPVAEQEQEQEQEQEEDKEELSFETPNFQTKVEEPSSPFEQPAYSQPETFASPFEQTPPQQDDYSSVSTFPKREAQSFSAKPNDKSKKKLRFVLTLVVIVLGMFYADYWLRNNTRHGLAGHAFDLVGLGAEAPIPPVATTDYVFPYLPSGAFTGNIVGLLPGTNLPLTILSFEEQQKLVILIGIEGWTPAVVSLADMTDGEKTGDTIQVRSNGFFLKLSGQNSSGALVGSFVNLVTQDEGEWMAQPMQE